MVRRILSALARAGLVASHAGIAGGAKLAKDPSQITLLEVYRAVKLKSNIGVHAANPECPMGAVIGEPLQSVLDETEQAVDRVLANKTIGDIAADAASRIVAKKKS